MQRASVYLLISIIAGALGQLMMKAGMQQLAPLSETVQAFIQHFELPVWTSLAWVIAGISCYLVAVLLWIRVLRVYPLSMAYPMLSLGYIVVYLGAFWWSAVGETLSLQKTLGIGLIIAGVIVIARLPQGNSRHE
jgi:undecaprenyl phosphate-alpha-L-ara4N flippase subunit ArnF